MIDDLKCNKQQILSKIISYKSLNLTLRKRFVSCLNLCLSQIYFQVLILCGDTEQPLDIVKTSSWTADAFNPRFFKKIHPYRLVVHQINNISINFSDSILIKKWKFFFNQFLHFFVAMCVNIFQYWCVSLVNAK